MNNAKDNKKKNGSIKKIIAAILILVVIALMSKKADAAALPMLPALPYVPPSRVQVWDLLNNIFGLTKLNISDEQKRLEAYEQMLGQYITQAEMDEIIQKAREARKMQIKAGIRDGLQEYMLYQVQTGYEEITVPTVVGAQETYDALMMWDKVNTTFLPYSAWQNFVSLSNAKFGVNQWTVYATMAQLTSGEKNMVIGSVQKNTKMIYYVRDGQSSLGNGYYPQGSTSNTNYNCVILYCYAYWITNETGTWQTTQDTRIGTRIYNSKATYDNYTLKGQSEFKKAIAQSTTITTALQNSSDIPLTANSKIVNGVLDTTGDIVTTLPATLPQAASDIQDLPAVQEQLGVLPAPISQDIEQSITQLQEQQAAQYGDTGEYAIDLTQLFPFCLPFDIYRILVAFEAEPETPQIHFELVNPWSNGENAEKWEAELDLSRFDWVAALVRKLELLLYCVGLAMITRQVFLRG